MIMGKGSQIFWFLNAEKIPTSMEQIHHYSHLSITNELKKIRRIYRRELKHNSSMTLSGLWLKKDS